MPVQNRRSFLKLSALAGAFSTNSLFQQAHGQEWMAAASAVSHLDGKEVAQNETQPLTFIRTREPYIDTEPVSAAPLKPSVSQDFRLIFDHVSPEWDGAYPEVRILRVQTR